MRPLYKEIIEKMTVFKDDFQETSLDWRAGAMQTGKLESVASLWENEANLNTINEVEFSYYLIGFKKAGTENFDEYLTLKFIKNKYWYGFTLVNHNNQQPFLKKLYHQQITKEDRQLIIDLLMNKVMDRIDWIIDMLKKNKPKDK